MAHDVTISGTNSFAALDGSSSDHDGAANGVFTVNDGNLVVNGTVNCNDDTGASDSACSMAFAVSGNMSVNAGGALYAENRSGSGTGGAITLTVGGSLALNGNAIVSTASKSSSGSTGGAITANVTGNVSVGAGSTIDSGSANARGGAIVLASAAIVTVDGNVLSGPSRTLLATRLSGGAALDGGAGNAIGGAITIGSSTFVEPAIVIGSTASIVSQGGDSGAGPVTIDGCGVIVRGLVAALSRKDGVASVAIRSGKDVLIDGRDLGGSGTRMGRIRADAPTGSAINKGVDIFAAETIDIFGPASGLYVVTSLPGLHDSKSWGGLIRITSVGDAVNGSGNLIDDGHTAAGDSGGTVEISAKEDVTLTAAVIRAVGDFSTNNPNRGGGAIRVRSYSGDVIWTNGTGEVRPVGSTSNLPLSDQGSIILTACGTVNTTGSSFPVMGAATSVFPETHTGVCSPAGPSLPTGVAPLVTCNTPPVANDASASTNEDTTVTITLTGTDADGDSLTFTIVSGPANGSLGPVISTGPNSATVDYTPNLNYNGGDSFVFRANDGNGGTDDATATIAIAAVNDPPSFLAGPTVTSLEDSGPQTYANWATAISAGPADESGQTVTFTVTNSNNALFAVQPAVDASGTLTFTPAANAYGSATITVTAQDNGGTANGGNDTSAPQSSTVNVTGVNDEPSFVAGTNQTAGEDAGPQSESGWATAINAGPNESGQTVSFILSNNNNALFSAQPAVASNGTLTYTPAANANGSATVTIYAQDDGGTANGGDDTSAPQTFTITVSSVNDAPSFTSGGNVTVLEDSGAYSAAWATAISAGPSDESGQTVAFSVSNDNNALFAAQPAIDASGNLTFTTAANASGSATVTVTLSDNGGTANGGSDTSAPQSFTVTITAVNDEPSFTSGGDVAVNEDSGAYSAAWASAISAGAGESGQSLTFHVSNDNAALFASQPAISASGVLTFTPSTNANGSATVSVFLKDDGGTANGGDDTSSTVTFTLTVNAVNDAPSFTGGGNVTVLEDSGAYSAAWATAISAGPADESGQSLTFNVTGNSNASLFATAPSISASGVLSFTLAANAFGSATITVTLSDDGGTANGGADTSAAQSFDIVVNGVNDEPSFTGGGNVTVLEDSGAYSASWASSISNGPGESGQSVTFFVSNDNSALFAAQPSIDAAGNLTFVPASNAYGTATVTVYAQDNGGTANGGDDTTSSQTFTITVDPVNDAPSFTSGGNVTVVEDSGAYSAAWASAISAGPANESTQSVSFVVTANSNAALFAVAPSVSSTGVLSFTLASNTSGSATITLHAQDDGGTANGGANTSASVSFTITVDGVNDAPTFTPGGNVTVNEDSGAYSATWATAISSGPNESGQVVTFSAPNDNSALFSVQPSINGAGVLTFTPAANAFGSATVTVTAQDNGGTANGGVDTSAAVTFVISVNGINDPPTAGNDAWETEGNTELRVDHGSNVTPHVFDTTPSGTGVLHNDADAVEGDPFTITGVVGCADTTAPYVCAVSGGTVTLEANGSFTFEPSAGATSASFQYTVTDQPAAGTPASATGTVTLTIHDMIWYVNGTAVAGGNGTSTSPFNNFASLNGVGDVDGPGAYIFVHNSVVNGSMVLETSQRLWGEGVGLIIPRNLNGNGSPTTLVAPGMRPNMIASGDAVLVLDVTGVEIAGLNITTPSGNPIDVTSTSGGPAASAAIYSNVLMATGAEGIDINADSAAGTVVSINDTAITSMATGVDLLATAGTVVFSFTNGSVASPAGSGIVVNGAAADALIVNGLANVTISGNTAGAGISITAGRFDANAATAAFETVNAGTIAIGAAGDPVGAAGMQLANASGDLAFGSLSAHGATTGVTITGTGLYTGTTGMRVTSGGGAISAAAGTGLTVTNTTIGSANLAFTSISSTGGANGIVVNNTGTSGGLKVLGTGTAGSGGTIQNTSSDAVRLVSTANVSLSSMNLTNSASAVTNGVACNFTNAGGCEAAVDLNNVANIALNQLVIDHNNAGQAGISGVGVNGLSVTNSEIREVGDADAESAILLQNASGTVLLQNVLIDAPEEYGVRVYQTTGTLSMTLRRVTVQNNLGTFGEAGASWRIEGGTATVLVDDSDFLNTDGPAVDGQAVLSGTLNLTLTGNTMNENRALPHGVNFVTSGSGTGRLTATTNTLTGCAVTSNCAQGFDLDAAGTSTLDAKITNNVISNPGIGSGIEFIVNDNAFGRAEIRNNTISVNVNRVGMNFLARAASIPGATGQLHLTVASNTVNGIDSSFIPGIQIAAGASTGTHATTVCANVSTLNGSGANAVNGTPGPDVYAFTLRQRTNTTFQLQGFTGVGTVPTAVETFVQSNNSGGTHGGATEVFAAAGSTIVNYSNATCQTPSATPVP